MVVSHASACNQSLRQTEWLHIGMFINAWWSEENITSDSKVDRIRLDTTSRDMGGKTGVLGPTEEGKRLLQTDEEV